MKQRIQINNVDFSYKGKTELAVEDVSLQINERNILLVTGSAGAGKTTLCRLINGAIPHFFEGEYAGDVLLEGKSITGDFSTMGEIAVLVGYVGQDPASQLICPTVEDEIAFALENFGTSPEETNREVEEQLKETGLTRYRNKNPHTLSGGEQQLCVIAAFLASKQGIMILDEPTSNIDPIGSARVFDIIIKKLEAQNMTPIIVEHKIDILAPLVNRMVVIDKGKIIFDGPPRKVLQNTEELTKIGIRVPQMVLLWKELKDLGVEFNKVPITVDEMATCLRPLLKRGIKVDPIEEAKGHSSTETVIKAENLSHTYPDGTLAIKDCSLTIKKGEFVGIVGQNGSGKTTLVKHFNALLHPTKGKVCVMGNDIGDFTADKMASTVGYCFQNPDDQIFKDKVKDELAFGPKNVGLSEEEIEKMVEMAAHRMEISDFLDVDPFTLSLGERTRVAVASVVAMNPEILIVDEPTTGQDYLRGDEIMRLVKEFNDRGATCIVITHDMQLCAKWVDRLIVTKEGRIFLDGTTREVFSQGEALETTNLHPPPITRLGQKLKQWLPENVLSVEEMADHIKTILGGNKIEA
ncbi:MAG: ATP-binding cassette domain-containing protein [Methanomicrobia archaeon]|nr:ATP-binding cassette domain-containing protein [Methanomicrobia archaeon]